MLQCVRTGFTGANANGLFDGADKNFAVANFFRLGSVDDGFDRAVNLVVVQYDFDFHLGQEVDHIFGAAL